MRLYSMQGSNPLMEYGERMRHHLQSVWNNKKGQLITNLAQTCHYQYSAICEVK